MIPAFSKTTGLPSLRRELCLMCCVPQDSVKQFPTEIAIQQIESELGKPLGEIFSEISEEPVAAASLAQVYKAVTLDGRTVAVKVCEIPWSRVYRVQMKVSDCRIPRNQRCRWALKGQFRCNGWGCPCFGAQVAVPPPPQHSRLPVSHLQGVCRAQISHRSRDGDQPKGNAQG